MSPDKNFVGDFTTKILSPKWGQSEWSYIIAKRF